MVAKKKKPAKVTRPAKKSARVKKSGTRAKKAATRTPTTRARTRRTELDPLSPTRPAIMADLFAARREILATVDREVCEIVDHATTRERRFTIASRVLPELVARDFGPEEAADLALHYADALIESARRPNAGPHTTAQSTTFAGEEDAPSLSAPVLAEPAILEPASVN